MLLPTSESAVLLVLLAGLVASGSWTSMFRFAKKWRFELFYYDFALGFALAAVAAAFTLGVWDPRDLTFQDNFLLAGRRKMAWVLGGGILLGLGDLLLLAAATVGGSGVGFIVAFGALIGMNTVWELLANGEINRVLASGGALMAVVAAAAAAAAYRWYLADREEVEAQALRADPRAKRTAAPKAGSMAGPFLAVLAGVVLTLFFRTLANGITGDNGVAPYSALLLLAAGVAGACVVFTPFFLYFPVCGGALQVRHYFKGTWKHHVLGLCAGAMGGAAILAYMLARTAPENAQASPLVSYPLSFGAPVVAAAWGLFAWREFAGAFLRVLMIFFVALVLLLGSLGVVSVSLR